MKKIWFIVAFLLLASLAVAFAAPPVIDAGIDHRLPTGTGIDPVAWRAAMTVFSQAQVTAAIATVAGDLSAHSNAVVAVHGAAAGTRFLTASETILDAQIPPITTLGGLSSATIRAEIATPQAEIDAHEIDASDPHGAILTQANLLVASATFSGYTGLGSAADGSPKIKVKKITATLPAGAGDQSGGAHGLTASKILAVTGRLAHDGGTVWITPGITGRNLNYGIYWGGPTVQYCLAASDSADIDNGNEAITLIFYEE